MGMPSAVIFLGGDKMHKNRGTQVIKTERLVLRPIRESDYNDVFEFASKEEVAKYVSWNIHKSKEDSKALCKMWASQYENGERYHWAITMGGKMIGNIEVVKIVNDCTYLGWQVDSALWNKGIMTEAASAVRDFLFNEVGFSALYATYITENIGSGRVMQKIGMKPITAEEYYKNLEEEIKTEIDGKPLSFCMIKNEVI